MHVLYKEPVLHDLAYFSKTICSAMDFVTGFVLHKRNLRVLEYVHVTVL